MYRKNTGTLVFPTVCLLVTVLSSAQTESVDNAFVVLSKCQAIATKAAKVMQQQRIHHVIQFWRTAENITAYVNKWSERVKAQGANLSDVNRCSFKFNDTVYLNREAMDDDLKIKADLQMKRFDTEMFKILAGSVKPDSFEKYVALIKSISDDALKTFQTEADSVLKLTVSSLTTSYQVMGNCLRDLMISADTFEN